MNKKIIFFMSLAASIGVLISMHTNVDATNLLLDRNVESLADVENIDGKWYVIDQIPCSSSATETRVDKSYVNCTTCRKEYGKATENLEGTCTSIRDFGV